MGNGMRGHNFSVIQVEFEMLLIYIQWFHNGSEAHL